MNFSSHDKRDTVRFTFEADRFKDGNMETIYTSQDYKRYI